MRIRLVFVGKRGDSDLADAVERYVKQTSRFVATDVTFVKPEPPGAKPDVPRILLAEAKRLEASLDPRDLVVACDAGGPHRTSEELAKDLRRWLDSSPRSVAFVVGGAFGLQPAFLAKARAILPLSRLTLPHQLARLVLGEQVYRAVAALSGVAYSK